MVSSLNNHTHVPKKSEMMYDINGHTPASVAPNARRIAMRDAAFCTPAVLIATRPNARHIDAKPIRTPARFASKEHGTGRRPYGTKYRLDASANTDALSLRSFIIPSAAKLIFIFSTCS